MTEAEWEVCGDPALMLAFLEGKASDRKLRLFAVACCRRIEHRLSDRRLVLAVETAEAAADGRPGPYGHDLKSALQLTQETHLGNITPSDYAALAANYSSWPVPSERHVTFLFAASHAAANAAKAVGRSGWSDERSAQAATLRDLVGNPFRPVSVARSWLTSPVLAIARAMYEARDFDGMPVLADALEEDGCDNVDVLSHCRGGGPHVRGCWMVDLILGRE